MYTVHGTDALPRLSSAISPLTDEFPPLDNLRPSAAPGATVSPAAAHPLTVLDDDPYALTAEMRDGLRAYSMRRDGIF